MSQEDDATGIGVVRVRFPVVQSPLLDTMVTMPANHDFWNHD
jgi:hypothetical protein